MGAVAGAAQHPRWRHGCRAPVGSRLVTCVTMPYTGARGGSDLPCVRNDGGSITTLAIRR